MRGVAAGLIVLVACGGREGGGTPDAAIPIDAAVDAPPPPTTAELCPVGRYRVVGLGCWIGNDYRGGEALLAAADASEVTVEVTPDGACRFRYRWAGATCVEEQEVIGRLRPPPRWGFELTSTGISRCEPERCAFQAGDDRCMVGTHGGTAAVDLGAVLDTSDLNVGYAPPLGPCAAIGATSETQTLRPFE